MGWRNRGVWEWKGREKGKLCYSWAPGGHMWHCSLLFTLINIIKDFTELKKTHFVLKSKWINEIEWKAELIEYNEINQFEVHHLNPFRFFYVEFPAGADSGTIHWKKTTSEDTVPLKSECLWSLPVWGQLPQVRKSQRSCKNEVIQVFKVKYYTFCYNHSLISIQ